MRELVSGNLCLEFANIYEFLINVLIFEMSVELSQTVFVGELLNEHIACILCTLM